MAFWLYTSGTTGAPKAVVHAHRTLLAGRHYGGDVLGVARGDRVFATSKLFFPYALGNALVIPLLARASAYLHPAWPDPASVAAVMQSYRPTLFFSVPTFYAALLRAALPPDTFASARACVSAGERLPAEIYEAWRARFGVEILDGMGATETVFMVLSNRPGESRAGVDGGARAGHRGGAARRRRSCGRRRRAGCALGQDAIGGDGLLQAPRPVAADLRRRVAPHRRRVSPRRRRLLRALRPRGRSLQGRRPVGDAGRARVGGAPSPRRAGRGRGRGGGCGRPRQALRLRGAAGFPRRAGRPRGGRAPAHRGEPAPPPVAARHHRRARSAAHGHRQAPALPAARSGPPESGPPESRRQRGDNDS